MQRWRKMNGDARFFSDVLLLWLAEGFLATKWLTLPTATLRNALASFTLPP
jgi:hypothetical protein